MLSKYAAQRRLSSCDTQGEQRAFSSPDNLGVYLTSMDITKSLLLTAKFLFCFIKILHDLAIADFSDFPSRRRPLSPSPNKTGYFRLSCGGPKFLCRTRPCLYLKEKVDTRNKVDFTQPVCPTMEINSIVWQFATPRCMQVFGRR